MIGQAVSALASKRALILPVFWAVFGRFGGDMARTLTYFPRFACATSLFTLAGAAKGTVKLTYPA
jgi:hypothetical protein